MAGTPARAAHGSADMYRAVGDGVRDRIANFRMRPAGRQRRDDAANAAEAENDRPERREPSDAERAQGLAESRMSTARSRRRIDAALSIPCAQCGAAKGSHCFSGGHGFCRERWDKALGIAVPRMQPGGLEPLAQAQRNTNFHQRQRPRNIAALQVRGGAR